MATDSTNLPQGETTLDAGIDMTASDLDLTTVQEVANEPKNFVDLPKGNTVILLPVEPGQTVRLPTDSTNGVLAKIGPEGNLAIVVDGRTIILQGFLKANDQSPVKIVTNDGDAVDVAELIAATDPSLDIQTAAGPASGDQGDTEGSGIYIPFLAGPGLGGILAEGILDPTALQYRLIDDEYRLFTLEEEDPTPDFTITFDVLGGIVNEDDLPGQVPDQFAAKFVFKEGGNYGEGNDPFDGTNYDDNDDDGIPDESDFNDNDADPDREPLSTVATVKVDFHGDVPGKLEVDLTKLPAGLTSEGQPIVYAIDPAVNGVHGNGIFGYVETGGGAGYQDGIDRLVFEVHVDKDKSDSEFKVTFTLHDNIDNEAPDENNDGSPDLLGANEQLLGLPVHFKITDSNGDSVDGTLPIQVVDDKPFFGEVVGVGEDMTIIDTIAEVTHDETKGAQSDDGADDQSFFDFVPFPFPHFELNIPLIELAADLYDQVINQAGFSLPYGDSVGALLGAAQSQVKVSFGADGATQEHLKDIDDATARESVFGAVSGSGENERPFELFMIDQDSVNGTVPVEDNKSTVADEGNLTASPQKTNMTVTWNGEVLPVWLVQIDANTIVGYIETGDVSAKVIDGIGAGKEAVLVIDINDAGVLSFFQLHQLNHPDTTNGDEQIQILAADNETPLIYVRATDYDGDHAIQPVTVGIQDDKPVFCKVDWGCDGDSKHGVGLIDEDKLEPNGNNDWWWGDDKGGKHADGEIIFNFGADKPGHLEVSNLEVKDSAGNILLNLALVIDPNDGSIDVSGLNNLKTADGEPITLVATLDAGTGLLTIVGQDAGGNPAFTFTLQTTGGDIGEFDFCLNQALYHPYTDLDSKNDGPLKAFEDNLKFDFTVVGKDVDGDSATGHIKVNVDDDSPKAECDVDCVTEGKDGDALNTATGNVVTGDGNTIFGNDSNNLDGNADSPGADQPYTISQIKHDGTTYELSADGQTVSNLGPDDSFDPNTGILKIKTAEGGTFEIVMVSDDQSQVGDYQYTVPENAVHKHGTLAGPKDLSQSVSGDFDTVSEWTSSFASKGITVQAINGNLDIKNIDVAGGGSSDYRGIGVENYEGDEVEVDRGGNEGLRLNLPSDTTNATLTIGALFDGTQYDNGHQEILQWTIYNNGFPVGSGQILGNNDGVVTLDIDSLVPFDRIELKPIDNGQGSSGNNSDFLLINAKICCPEDKFTEEFEYTLRDADGDESCATLKVDVKDTAPEHENPHTIITTLLVDEDGLPNGVGNTNSPQDNEEDHNLPNAPVDDAKHFGTIPFTPGADPTSIELTVLGGPDTGLKTLDNKKILAAWDSTLKALIGYVEGTDPNDAANQVFKMTILDPLTGAYSFELLQAVKHDNTDLFGSFNDTENVLNTPANFVVVAQIEDKDCDVIYSKVVVSIDDDMPVITPCYERGDLLVNGSFEDLGTEDGGTLENGNWGVFSQIPGWKSGADEANPSGVPGLEIQSGAVIAAKDGKNYVELDSDDIDPGSPSPSTTNASIYQDVTTNDGDNYVLTFSYSPRTGDENSDGIEVWFDGQLITTIDSGTVGQWTDYTFVVKAGEGDGTPDLSRLEFKAVGSADELGGFIDDVSLTSCAIVDEDALPNGIEGGPGDDGPIGACFSGNLGVNFGADGGKSIVFNTTGQPTLFSHGVQVKYAWDNATQTLIGYTGANVPANWVFTVKVETLDNGGEYKFTLLKPLDHPDSNNFQPDDKTDNGTDSFEDNLVFDLKFKATDRDDDTVEGKLRINVDDDSPSGDLVKIKVDPRGDGALVHDETKGIDNPDDVAGPLPQFNVLGLTAIGFATTQVNVDLSGGGGNPDAAYGADGPGTTTLSLTGPGGLPFSGAATNLFDTATGEPIFLYTEGGLVVGRIGSGGVADVGGEISFALSIDNAGNLSVAQYRAIQHPDETDHDDSVTLLAAGGEDAIVHITAKITDYDGDAITVTVPLDGAEGGNGAIKFEDDGPTATCDYDCVVEGKNDQVPNYATGNVVTGNGNTVFGNDANNLDGNPDNPGVDGPYTISKLTHGGVEYFLNTPEGGIPFVTKGAPAGEPGSLTLGGDEVFDPTTGKLHIPTQEGGTLDIVLISDTQSQVGDYKYTVPCDAEHAHDKHFGPESLAETRSEAFDHVDEWTAAFSADGITLTNIGGTGFAIKNIDVNPKTGFGGAEDYRGIGISGGIDGAEVDTHQETMQLQFATPTDNAEVLIGAFFDGTQFDNGFQEIIEWKALGADGVTVIASGQILGSDNGLVTLDIDTNGEPFTYIQLTPLNNGAGGNSGNNSDFVLVNVEVCCDEDKFQEQFDYTLRDGDGDESTATLKIDVKDTKPSIPDAAPLCLTVDEDGLPAGVGNSDSPNDALATDNSASGFIPFTPGADPVKIELSVAGGDTGLETLAGQTVLAAWDAESSTLIGYIAGTDPSDAANQVFKMTVTNHQTGAVTFDLLKPIKHADGGQDDNTENWPDPTVVVDVQIEDKDCDVAYTTVHVKIDDDMPVFKHLRADGDGLVVHDETAGEQGEDQELGDLPQVFKDLTKASPIGWAEDEEGESSISLGFEYGADGPGDVDVDLGLTSASGVDSGLFTTAGSSIWLFQEGDLVVGRVGSGLNGGVPDAAGAIAFAVNVENDGDLQVAQYLSLKHPTPGNDDESVSINSAALQAVVTVTDADGDSVSKTVDIGSLVKFEDDGPRADDDTDSVQEDVALIASGNVYTGTDGGFDGTKDANSTDGDADNAGQDGLKSLVWTDGGEGGKVDTNGEIAGLYGTLYVQPDGDYQYKLNNDHPAVQGLSDGETLSETFQYKIVDGDDDPDSATLKITIKGKNDGVTITDLTPKAEGGDAIVYEEALNAAQAGTDGSDPASTKESAIGTFKITAPDGLDDVTISDGNDSITIVNNGAFVAGQKINNSDLGNTLEILSFDKATGIVTYKYTLEDDETHPDATKKDSIFDDFKVFADDVDGSSTTATLSIQVVDDVPTARADTDEVTEDTNTVTTGNVITSAGTTNNPAGKDTPGADDTAVISKVVNFAAASITPDANGETIAGKYGSLKMESDGDYTYTLNNSDPAVQGLGDTDSLTETFTYTLKDADGDVSPTTLTITIKGKDDPVLITDLTPSTNGGDATVYEKGLPTRGETPGSGEIADGNGTNNSDPSEVGTGNFKISAPDGVKDVTVHGITIIDEGVLVPGPIVITTPLGNELTITGYNPATGVITYSYLLKDNESHPVVQGPNEIYDNMVVTLNDEDLDSANATLAIKVVDDVPDAKNDTDAVLSGKLTTTGNVITGDGTTNDPAGDDVPGADGATVTKIAGFGGDDATFDAGVLEVAGKYGTLKIEADGDYTYTRNGGVIGPVQDVFTYTLTDGDGDTDTATLTIDIANSGIEITDLTPKAEGDTSVNEKGLPIRGGEPAGSGEAADGNGTDNDDTSETNTGNFKVTAPDGVGEIKIGSSVVYDGTTFTPTTITTSLGELSITGFDKATGVVSYSYTLKDNANHTGGDVFDDFAVSVKDVDGETDTDILSVKIIDDVPNANDDTDSVAAGTYGPETGNVITGVGTTSGAAGADVPGADGVTVTKITNFDGTNSDTVFDGGVLEVAGKYGTLKIEADGDYTYTRNPGTPGGVQDVFNYTLTDGDTDTDTAKLVIDIKDSSIEITDLTPKATGDTSVNEKGLPIRGGEPAGSGEAADGNGTDNDDTSETNTGNFKVTAADGVGEIKIGSSVVFDGTTFTPTTLTTSLGELKITGYDTGTGVVSYSYTLKDNANHTGGDVFDDFAVSVKDKDGDTDTDTLSVKIIDDVPTARPDTDSVTEDAVPNTAIGNVMTGTGTTEGTGGSGTDTPGADGASVTKITGAGGSDAVFDGGVLEVAGKYGTLKIEADGDYTYTLNNANPDVEALNDGGKLIDEFTYRLTDGDADTSDSTLKITINGKSDDKQPVTYDDVALVAEPSTKHFNLVLIFDVSGSMNAPSGIGGLTKLDAAKQAANNMLDTYAANAGDVRVMLVWFNQFGNRQETWLDITAAKAAINAIPASDNSALTNYETAILNAIAGFNDVDGRGDTANHEGVVYFLSDGEPTVGGNEPNNDITDGTLAAWDSLLENAGNNIDRVHSIGLGTAIPGGASNQNLIDVADPDGNDNPANSVILVDDLADLNATLVGTVGTPVSGNILNGANESDPDAGAPNTPDNPGDAPAHLSYFEYDSTTNNDLDIKITWDGVGAVVVDGVANGKGVSIAGKEVTFTTEFGKMLIDFSDGDFKFTPVEVNADKVETFNYKTTDNDGDISNQSTLKVTIDDLPSQILIEDISVKEGGTAQITVSLTDPAPAGGLTLGYTFTSGSATLGSDFAAAPGGATITIPAGKTSATITVNASIDAALFEGDETYNVVLSGAPAGWSFGDNSGTVHIIDNTTITVPLTSHNLPSGGWPGGVSGKGFDDEDGDKATGVGSDSDGWDGEGGDDSLNGAGGDDHLDGEDDNDTLIGGSGNDRLVGNDDNDVLDGGSGNDLLFGGSGFDKLDGGLGNDWLDVDAADFAAGRSIKGGDGIDVLDMNGIGTFTLTGKTTDVSGIEIIQLEGGGQDKLSLKASDVTDIANGTLFIWGSDGDDDEVSLTGGGWTQIATNQAGNDGENYNVFQNGAVKVFVDTDIDTTTS